MEPKVRENRDIRLMKSGKILKFNSRHLYKLLRRCFLLFVAFLGEEFLYVTPIDQDTIVRVTINGKKPAISKEFFFLKLLQKTLLPHGEIESPLLVYSDVYLELIFSGYPDSVSEDYLDYQKWDTLQAFASTINGCLATHSVLKGKSSDIQKSIRQDCYYKTFFSGLGVGDQTSTPLSATITWILKDGAGHVGRILFAYWKG